ncbi:hypothetical protein BJY52DRAFT_1295665 [Lactarius psammicola]|nr:hypothetical protein BJY52DRAFT_1295665 [Lactarius psammicola]
MTASAETLLEKLQIEFHSLDSSLIAAFLSEFPTESPTRRQLRGLRQTLTKLAVAASDNHDEQSISEALSDSHIDDSHIDGSSLSGSTFEGYSGTLLTLTTDSTSPLASPRSTSSCATSFSSPLGFLRTAFPGVPLAQLESAIADATCKDGWAEDVDIERAVQLLLTQEYLRALEEGGLDSLEDDLTPVHSPEWLTVKAKGKKKKAKTKTYTINDIRQQQHISERAHRRSPHRDMPPRPPDVDIWTAVSSISAQLSSLLPPHSEAFFKSFFHSPESKSPSAALRRALTAITSAEDTGASPPDTTVLLSLQDILRSTPEYNEQGPEERERILSDARLCLRAVQSRHGDALDLVWLLHGLDSGETAEVRLHSQECQDDHTMELSTSPPSPTFEATYTESFSGLRPGRPPSQSDEWNVVPRRKPPSTINPHAGFIPVHNDMSKMRIHQIDSERHKDSEKLKRLKYLEGRLTETHMSAARAWKGANSKNMGKEVALYHVDEARKLREELKSAALDVARARVGATKKTDASLTTIDLHYTTISQAVILAKEFLEEYGASNVRPMRFITGRGNRSVGGKGVLGPAVYNALIEDGWNVSMFAGSLTIRGRIGS